MRKSGIEEPARPRVRVENKSLRRGTPPDCVLVNLKMPLAQVSWPRVQIACAGTGTISGGAMAADAVAVVGHAAGAQAFGLDQAALAQAIGIFTEPLLRGLFDRSGQVERIVLFEELQILVEGNVDFGELPTRVVSFGIESRRWPQEGCEEESGAADPEQERDEGVPVATLSRRIGMPGGHRIVACEPRTIGPTEWVNPLRGGESRAPEWGCAAARARRHFPAPVA